MPKPPPPPKLLELSKPPGLPKPPSPPKLLGWPKPPKLLKILNPPKIPKLPKAKPGAPKPPGKKPKGFIPVAVLIADNHDSSSSVMSTTSSVLPSSDTSSKLLSPTKTLMSESLSISTTFDALKTYLSPSVTLSENEFLDTGSPLSPTSITLAISLATRVISALRSEGSGTISSITSQAIPLTSGVDISSDSSSGDDLSQFFDKTTNSDIIPSSAVSGSQPHISNPTMSGETIRTEPSAQGNPTRLREQDTFAPRPPAIHALSLPSGAFIGSSTGSSLMTESVDGSAESQISPQAIDSTQTQFAANSAPSPKTSTTPAETTPPRQTFPEVTDVPFNIYTSATPLNLIKGSAGPNAPVSAEVSTGPTPFLGIYPSSMRTGLNTFVSSEVAEGLPSSQGTDPCLDTPSLRTKTRPAAVGGAENGFPIQTESRSLTATPTPLDRPRSSGSFPNAAFSDTFISVARGIHSTIASD